MIDFGFGVNLRAIEFNDLEQLREWRNHPDIMKWTRQYDILSHLDQKKWFHSINDNKYIKMYSIFYDDSLSGVCGLTSIDQKNQRAEISLYIAPELHGLGLGLKTAKTLLKHGFENMNLNCIWGEMFQGSYAEKLFNQLKFKKEGTRRSFYFRNGKFIDAHLFSLLRSEFISNNH